MEKSGTSNSLKRSHSIITISSESESERQLHISSESEEYSSADENEEFVNQHSHRFYDRLDQNNSNVVEVLLNISELQPDFDNWLIIAYVLNKRLIMPGASTGDAQLSLILKDYSGEIRARMSSELQEFFDNIVVGHTYCFAKCLIVPVPNKIKSIVNNKYELNLNKGAIIQEVPNSPMFKIMKYDFVPVDEIPSLPDFTVVDVLAKCSEIGPLKKNYRHCNYSEVSNMFEQKAYRIVEVCNVNESMRVDLHLWEDLAEKKTDYLQQIVLIKGAVVKDKCLHMVPDSIMETSPLFKDKVFANWLPFSPDVSTDEIRMLTFEEVDSLKFQNEQSVDYFKCRGTIKRFYCKYFYKSCSIPLCFGKVRKRGDKFICKKCDFASTSFKNQLLVELFVSDSTNTRWISCPTEITDDLMGLSSTKLTNEIDKFPILFASRQFFSNLKLKSFLFTLRDSVCFNDDLLNFKTIAINVESIPD